MLYRAPRVTRRVLLGIGLAVTGLAPSGATESQSATKTSSEPVEPTPEERQAEQQGPIRQLGRIWQWGGEQLRDFTRILLPDTQERHTFRVSVSPRLGDFINHDHVRLPVSLRYGFNRRADGEFEVDYYFPNPFEESEGSGIANYRFTGKYRWRREADDVDGIEIASGVRIVIPASSSPPRFNHGMDRYSVYTTMARPIPKFQDVDGFVTVSYDWLVPSEATGFIHEDEPQDDFVEIVTGFVRQREKYQYGLSIGWAYEVEGPNHNFFTVTPSVLYDIPPKYVFNSPGRWQLGLAVEGKRYGAETDVSFKVRGRWVIDFKRAWRVITGQEKNGAASE